MFSAVSSQEHEPGPFTAFHDRVRRLLADLEADREDLELAITDGAARRMLLSAVAVAQSRGAWLFALA